MDGWTARTLDLLDAALCEADAYLLGDRPTIGDFGVIGPHVRLHLGRDPLAKTLSLLTRSMCRLRGLDRSHGATPPPDARRSAGG